MASARDVIDALNTLHIKTSERAARAPTGVVPGYHASIGAAVTEDGRLRYVSAIGRYAWVEVNSSDQTIATSTTTKLSWDTELADTINLFSAGTPTRLTASVSGMYIAALYVTWASNSTGKRLIEFIVNATTPYGRSEITALTSGFGMGSTIPIYLSAGDYIECEVFQDSGGNLDIRGGTDAGGYHRTTCYMALIG